jgi:NAD+ synthetase
VFWNGASQVLSYHRLSLTGGFFYPAESINLGIIKPPSAGLWEGQTDEGEMGITYEELDTIIAGIESGNTEGLNPALVEKARRMHASSEHKRRLPPSFPD